MCWPINLCEYTDSQTYKHRDWQQKTEKIEVVNRDGWKLIDYNGERRLLTTDAKQLRHVWRHDTWVYWTR